MPAAAAAGMMDRPAKSMRSRHDGQSEEGEDHVNTSRFDALTRHAAVVSRRGSFRVLGGAAVAGALAAPATVTAGKGGEKVRKRCQKQRGQCLSYVAEACNSETNSQACEALYTPCCGHFAQCDAGKGLECFFRPIEEL
jgi:hypothetical protein